jgi:LPS O-antigen subunit length determinant protein (WzzB/FepE family)
MQEQVVQLDDIIDGIRRHSANVLLFAMVGLAAGLLALPYIPKRFKSSAVINIPSHYFSNPMVRDFMAEPTDPQEKNSQRLSQIRLALTDEFLDELGETNNIFEFPRGTTKRINERDLFRKRIEFFNANPTSIQLSVTDKDPKIAHSMMQEVLDQVTFSLVENRFDTLVRARDAIQTQAAFLSRALKGQKRASEADTLIQELDKINQSVAALRTKYTDSHPEVYKLRQEAAAVEEKLRTVPSGKVQTPEPETAAVATVIQGSNAEHSIEMVYDDLFRKLSYLSITLNMERDKESVSFLSIIEKPNIPTKPVFPKKSIVLFISTALGIFFSGIYILFLELRRSRMITPATVAESLDTIYLGELPVMKVSAAPQRLLDQGKQRYLPYKTNTK